MKKFIVTIYEYRDSSLNTHEVMSVDPIIAVIRSLKKYNSAATEDLRVSLQEQGLLPLRTLEPIQEFFHELYKINVLEVS